MCMVRAVYGTWIHCNRGKSKNGVVDTLYREKSRMGLVKAVQGTCTEKSRMGLVRAVQGTCTEKQISKGMCDRERAEYIGYVNTV